MNYKKGDKVILYSWEELTTIYGVDKDGSILLPDTHLWYKFWDRMLPKNRIVTIISFGVVNNSCYDQFNNFFSKQIIKCHVNEYYLNIIKLELDMEKDK